MNLAKSIIIAYLSLLPAISLGQSNSIQYWNTEKGLSNDWISQITQDQAGYIWIATQYGLNRFDGYEFKHYRYDPNDGNSLSANWAYSMTQDSSGIIWTGAYLAGVDAFNPKTGKTKRYQLWAKDSSRVSSIRFITCDQEQTIWLSSSAGLFAKKINQAAFEHVFDQRIYDYQISPKTNEIFILTEQAIVLFNRDNQSTKEIFSFEFGTIRKIYLDHSNNLWTFGKNGLLKIAKYKGQWQSTKVLIDNLAHSDYFYNSPIYEDRQQQLWIGGQDGISIIQANRKKAKKIPYSSLFPKGSSHGKALSFLEDRHGNVWIGTTKGLLLKSSFSQRFELTPSIPHLANFTDVREVLQLSNQLWVADLDGLFSINLAQPQLPPRKILSERIFSLLVSKDGYLYAGGSKLYQIHLPTLTIRQIEENKGYLRRGMIWAMAEDKSGKIWLGGLNLLQRYNPQTDKIDHFSHKTLPSLKAPPTQDLLIDKKGRLWAGSLTQGLFLLENPGEVKTPETAVFQQITFEKDKKNSLSNPMVLFLAEGKDNRVWVATDGGLNCLNPNNFKVERFLKEDGLKDEKVMSLVVDEQGDIWGSTIGHGIFKLDTKNQNFTFFDRKDGLASNNYLLSSVHKNKDGLLFFGSDNQVQVIDPVLVNQANKPNIPFLFTELNLANRDLKIKQPLSLTHQALVELPHDYQAFTVHYTTLNYFQAQKTQYEYLLDGVHSDWQNNGTERSLTFTGLSSGTYQLKVKAINPDLNFIQDTIHLNITISPPWWQTWWAYVGYGLLFFTGIYSWYQFQLNRQLEKAETKRLQELDTLKTRFFTNITHELRTPLTIILGMANQLKSFSKKEVQYKAQLIRRNGQQLLDLINQILDLSKLESGKLPLQMVHGDLIPYLNYLLESFHSIAADKGIRFHFLSEIDTLWMDFDKEKIKLIITNLIGNALKHTPEDGDIYLQIKTKENQVVLLVKDTGKGIADTQILHIFDRFYQTTNNNEGTGIGLSLTKELIHLLAGKISVESKKNKGSTFKVVLPILKQEGVPLASDEVPTSIANADSSFIQKIMTLNKGKGDDTPLVLLIEDNEDVLIYLADCLKKRYRLAIARNGQIGIHKAMELIPDLIVSDVMMPEKDGFEVCQVLKKDKKTSHIPVILLTAKADGKSKIIGLEYGADAYLHKPFDQEELVVRIRKLLELRQLLQQRFQAVDFWENPTAIPGSIEDAFILKVRQLIEDNLNDTHFGIPQLCQKLGISRVHLHRKLKALTNQSTTHFIRRIRLQKAKKLLQNPDLNISEIAYTVGFADPAYFSRLYSETFGEAPSVTRK